LIEVLTQFERQDVVAGGVWDNPDNAIPLVPQLGNESIGFIAKKLHAPIYKGFTVQVGAVDTIPALVENDHG